MPGFVDASFNLDVEPDTGSPHFSKKRKKTSEFREESLSLLRSCLQYGTLTAEVKANVDGLGLRSHFPLFFGNSPGSVTVQSAWYARAASTDFRMLTIAPPNVALKRSPR